MKTMNLTKTFSATLAAAAMTILTACGSSHGNGNVDSGAVGIYGTGCGGCVGGETIPIASAIGDYSNGSVEAELALDMFGTSSPLGINSKGTPLYVGNMAASGYLRLVVPACGAPPGVYSLTTVQVIPVPGQPTYDASGTWGPLVMASTGGLTIEVSGYTATGPGTSYFGAPTAPYRLGVEVDIYINGQLCNTSGHLAFM